MYKVTPVIFHMIFDELVHTQKQFVELAGHFVVRGKVIFKSNIFF